MSIMKSYVLCLESNWCNWREALSGKS